MTKLTAILIQRSPGIYGCAFGPVNGKYGLYVGIIEKAPPGSKRERTLVTSDAKFDIAAEASAAAEDLIKTLRGLPLYAA